MRLALCGQSALLSGAWLSVALSWVKSTFIHRTGSANFAAAVTEMQGWRVDHEDAFACHCDWADGGGLFIVLDGHGGSKSSRWAAEGLVEELTAVEDKTNDSMIQDAFCRTDEKLKDYLGRDGSGSTCVCVMVLPTGEEGTFIVKVANIGDSRCLLGHRADGKSCDKFDCTEDHKPENPEEKSRIEAAGGFVSLRVPARLDGVLSLSRAFGDFTFKQNEDLPWDRQRCSACPEMYTWEAKRGDCLVLACDGIFDVLTNRDLIREVDRLKASDSGEDLGFVTSSIVNKCLALNSQDNMTLMMVELGAGEEHVREDELTLGGFEREMDEKVIGKYKQFALDHGFQQWPKK